MSFCGAIIRPGFDLVAEILDLETAIHRADVVITGEGRLDEQTLEGKAASRRGATGAGSGEARLCHCRKQQRSAGRAGSVRGNFCSREAARHAGRIHQARGRTFEGPCARAIAARSYSALSAIIGSTRLARRAGIQQARSATVASRKVTPINVVGSIASTP